jgi:hypothetical protein
MDKLQDINNESGWDRHMRHMEPINKARMKQFKTEKETHNIPTSISVVDSASCIYAVCYETFKEYFIEKGYDTEEKWENFLDNEYSDIDSCYIEDIANFYNLEWAYINEDGSGKGYDYFVIYTKEQTQ